MKVLRIYADAQKTCARIIHNGQEYDAIYKDGHALLFDPVFEKGGSEVKSAPPEAGTETVNTLTYLLEAMDYVVHADIETASIPPMTKVELTPHYATEWTLGRNWDPSI